MAENLSEAEENLAEVLWELPVDLISPPCSAQSLLVSCCNQPAAGAAPGETEAAEPKAGAADEEEAGARFGKQNSPTTHPLSEETTGDVAIAKPESRRSAPNLPETSERQKTSQRFWGPTPFPTYPSPSSKYLHPTESQTQNRSRKV